MSKSCSAMRSASVDCSRAMTALIAYGVAVVFSDVCLDPACGSSSLLIRAAEAAHVNAAICGQEKEIATTGLARKKTATVRLRLVARMCRGFRVYSGVFSASVGPPGRTCPRAFTRYLGGGSGLALFPPPCISLPMRPARHAHSLARSGRLVNFTGATVSACLLALSAP